MDELATSIVGVLDLLDGIVVRAIGGDRDRYQPWQSPLAGTSDPLAIARAFREHYQVTQLYIADLNALQGGTAARAVIQEIVADGFGVTLDAGPRTAAEIATALDAGVETVVIPLETLPHRSRLVDWSREFDLRRLAFGLDLADGMPRADSGVWDMPDWGEDAPGRIAGDVIAMGISRLIVLDVRAVGRAAGPAIIRLCATLRRSVPTASIWTGGGARDATDIARLRAAGAERVLVATALHERAVPIDNHREHGGHG